MLVVITLRCPHCDNLTTETIEADGNPHPTIVCDNDSCGMNFDVSVKID